MIFTCVTINTADFGCNSLKQLFVEPVCNTFLRDFLLNYTFDVFGRPNTKHCDCLFGEYLFSNFKATLQKKTSAEMFSSEICKNFKNTFFVKYLQTFVSVYCQANINLEKSLLERNLLLIHLMICQK